METTPVRVLLYSHDSQGLGHVRRNLTIAHHIAAAIPAATGRPVSGLLVSGLAPASVFPLPQGFDWLTIPGISKGKDGYQPRSLGEPTHNLIRLRSELLKSTLLSFAPDLVIIDRHIYGVWKELFTPLEQLRTAHPHTSVVLGLREVLDEPAVAAAEWESIPDFFTDRLRFTGYLANGRRVADHDTTLAPEPFILTTAGGGSDGYHLLKSATRIDVPAGHRHIIVTGPQLEERAFKHIASLAGPNTEVHRSWPGLSTQIARASAVIAMGGYNTVCEILCTDTPGLLIPREHPRREQLIRAESLHGARAIDYLRVGAVSTDALSAWVADAVHRTVDRSSLARDGLNVAAHYATELIHHTDLVSTEGSTLK